MTSCGSRPRHLSLQGVPRRNDLPTAQDCGFPRDRRGYVIRETSFWNECDRRSLAVPLTEFRITDARRATAMNGDTQTLHRIATLNAETSPDTMKPCEPFMTTTQRNKCTASSDPSLSLKGVALRGGSCHLPKNSYFTITF